MNSQLENTINKTHSSPVMLLHMPWSHLDQSPLQEALQNIFFFLYFCPALNEPNWPKADPRKITTGAEGAPMPAAGPCPQTASQGRGVGRASCWGSWQSNTGYRANCSESQLTLITALLGTWSFILMGTSPPPSPRVGLAFYKMFPTAFAWQQGKHARETFQKHIADAKKEAANVLRS